MDSHFQLRIKRLREKLKTLADKKSAGNLLVTSLPNIRYLTGFTGSSGTLLVSESELIIVSDGRYEEQLATQCPNLEALIRPLGTTMVSELTNAMNKRFAGDFLFEQGTILHREFLDISEQFDRSLVGCKTIIEELRAIKDSFELELIRKSIEINERVFEEVIAWIDDSTTERDVAAEIEYRGRRYGADGCSFEPIVAVGSNSALAHYRPGNVKLNQSPFTLIDWGLFYGGYASDLTRVLRRGDVPTQYQEIYDVTLAAQQAAIAAVKPGVELKELDQVARGLIEEAGFGDQFSHSLGHGIGLEIHEGPALSVVAKGRLKEGMVITIEPGIYIPGLGGVRIEDDVWVTAQGGEVLSHLPKD